MNFINDNENDSYKLPLAHLYYRQRFLMRTYAINLKILIKGIVNILTKSLCEWNVESVYDHLYSKDISFTLVHYWGSLSMIDEQSMNLILTNGILDLSCLDCLTSCDLITRDDVKSVIY